MRSIALLLISLYLVGCAKLPTVAIIEKPIVFDQEREQLSIEYLAQRHGLEQTTATIDPKMVVVHWTVIPTLEQTFITTRYTLFLILSKA